ncbi:MAG: hypothetical protein ACE5FO_02410 [Parvularculaceae bacterium]
MSGKSWFVGVAAAATLITGVAGAQEEVDNQDAALFQDADAPEESNPDEIADALNSQQQLKQTFTLERRINGEVVETQKRTITYSRDDPLRASEAGQSPVEALKAQFEAELLTRTEAFEEAKLLFALADVNRDDLINADEFAAVIIEWSETDRLNAPSTDEETARERRIREFMAELDREAARNQAAEQAKKKFAFMAGASQTMTQADFIREYLLDFDSMDADGDTLLKGEELYRFRALNRGETVAIVTE